MCSDFESIDQHFITSIEELCHGYRGGHRVKSVVTSSIPSRFPAKVLHWVSKSQSFQCQEQSLYHVATAIEYTTLHAYLHSIPAARDESGCPTEQSPYATNPTAAILDGDFIQAHAFSFLAKSPVPTDIQIDGIRLLSNASLSQYESASESDPPLTLGAISGFAAKLGAIMNDVDPTIADILQHKATELGNLVPFQSPHQPSMDQAAISRFEATLEEVRSVLEQSDSSSVDPGDLTHFFRPEQPG